MIKGIVDLAPSRIVYVSCDPATLARDLKKLIAQKFEVESVTGFDMFPQTHHVETVVHLKLSDKLKSRLQNSRGTSRLSIESNVFRFFSVQSLCSLCLGGEEAVLI